MFRIDNEDKHTDARTGLFETGHGVVQTPAFLPVATKGAVKTLDSSDLVNLGVNAVIVNAFHLWLRGIDVIEEIGGLHSFMNWNKPIFTDSGGFQIIRKDFDFKLKDEGFVLKSPINGASVLYSPEVCMEVQSKLGSDVAFALDDCPPYPSDKTRIEESVKRTREWGQQCVDAKGRDQKLFGIAQGGTEPDLREQSALMLAEMGLDGYGIGGLSIGEPTEDMVSATMTSLSSLPKDSPKHLMGVGSPAEILECISLGIDFFDSAFPTRNARHGTFYTTKGKHDIRKRKFSDVKGPLDENCGCSTCSDYSTSYIHHLFKEKEMLAYRLLSIHNLCSVVALMADAREAVKRSGFLEFKDQFISEFIG